MMLRGNGILLNVDHNVPKRTPPTWVSCHYLISSSESYRSQAHQVEVEASSIWLPFFETPFPGKSLFPALRFPPRPVPWTRFIVIQSEKNEPKNETIVFGSNRILHHRGGIICRSFVPHLRLWIEISEEKKSITVVDPGCFVCVRN